MKESNNNIFDYLIWRGDVELTNKNINIIDLGMFSQLSLVDLDDVAPSVDDDNELSIEEISNEYFKKDNNRSYDLGLIVPNTILSMLYKMSLCDRFKNIIISNYVNDISIEKEEQFSALTIKIDDNTYCISFSGTDDTIIGWKENLNMLFPKPVAAQVKAKEYVEKMMRKYNGNFYICGHSKGGNLSLYSSLMIDDNLKNRIIKVYSFDGPGLNSDLSDKLEKDIIYDKITTVIPQSSTIGRLFEHREKTLIVRSFQVGFYQHDIFSWSLKGKDFIYEKELTEESRLVDAKVKEIISGMTDIEKEKFVGNLYTILSQTEAFDLVELTEKKKKIIEGYFKLPKEERRYVYDPLKKLIADRKVQYILFSSIRAFTSANKVNMEASKEIQDLINEKANEEIKEA